MQFTLIQILNLLVTYVWPIVKYFIDFNRETKNQNYWNDSEKAKDNTFSLPKSQIEKVTNTTNKNPDGIFFPITGSSKVQITSKFGYRNICIGGKTVRQFHLGLDIGGIFPVYASEDCIIKDIRRPDPIYPVRFRLEGSTWIDMVASGEIPADRAWTPYIILIGTRSKICYKYKHVRPEVVAGQMVRMGEGVAESGNFGYSMGPHLHLEIWPYDEITKTYKEAIDPEKFLKSKGLLAI